MSVEETLLNFRFELILILALAYSSLISFDLAIRAYCIDIRKFINTNKFSEQA